jgi:hypothetical protein
MLPCGTQWIWKSCDQRLHPSTTLRHFNWPPEPLQSSNEGRTPTLFQWEVWEVTALTTVRKDLPHRSPTEESLSPGTWGTAQPHAWKGTITHPIPWEVPAITLEREQTPEDKHLTMGKLELEYSLNILFSLVLDLISLTLSCLFDIFYLASWVGGPIAGDLKSTQIC